MIFILHVPGATPPMLERGVAAAHAVLDAAGLTPTEAAIGHWAREEWKRSRSTGATPADDVMEAAATFALAQTSAIDACCNGQPAPAGCWLEASNA